jgi:hypothetical protein
MENERSRLVGSVDLAKKTETWIPRKLRTRVLPVRHEGCLKNPGKTVSAVHSFLCLKNTRCKQLCQESELVINKRKDVGKMEEGWSRRNDFSR